MFSRSLQCQCNVEYAVYPLLRYRTHAPYKIGIKRLSAQVRDVLRITERIQAIGAQPALVAYL